MAAVKKKTTSKTKSTEAKTEKQEESITLLDTFFKTEKLTLNPNTIQGIEVNGNSYKVHAYSSEKPYVAILGEGEDLAVLTERWAEAVYNREKYELATVAAREAIFKSDAPTLAAENLPG